MNLGTVETKNRNKNALNTKKKCLMDMQSLRSQNTAGTCKETGRERERERLNISDRLTTVKRKLLAVFMCFP